MHRSIAYVQQPFLNTAKLNLKHEYRMDNSCTFVIFCLLVAMWAVKEIKMATTVAPANADNRSGRSMTLVVSGALSGTCHRIE